MLQRRVILALVVASTGLYLTGCGVVDPERPVPYPDTTVFGNLMEVEQPAQETDEAVVRLRVGIPRALTQAKEAEGKPTPTVEKGTAADIRVGGDTVVLQAGRPVTLEEIDPGTEVVALPVMGTTRMVGATIVMDASYFMDFATYRAWKLPGLGGEEPVAAGGENPERINSAGSELAPVPVANGRVLYFTARLRVHPEAGHLPIGARRPGLPEDAAGAPAERSYRTELGDDGWTAPRPVAFPGLDEAQVVRVTWVAEDETACLVTVQAPAELPWVGQATRAASTSPWGAVERMSTLGEGYASDAVFLKGSSTKLAFVTRMPGASQSDLTLLDPQSGDTPLPLAPNVNTPGDEWNPRVGPQNELFFCRGDRQLVLSGGAVLPMALPGPHRTVFSQAAPTGDGSWVFFSSPTFTAVELDQDIYVAEWRGGGELGEATPVDEWRP